MLKGVIKPILSLVLQVVEEELRSFEYFHSEVKVLIVQNWPYENNIHVA